MERSPDKVKSKDKGPDIIERYRYQYSYTCLLAVKLHAGKSQYSLMFDEIICEHHEDILGVTKDRKFVGIQIKSREKEIPFTLGDKKKKMQLVDLSNMKRNIPTSLRNL